MFDVCLYLNPPGLNLTPASGSTEPSTVLRRRLDCHGLQFARLQMTGFASGSVGTILHRSEGSTDNGTSWQTMTPNTAFPTITDGLSSSDWFNFPATLADEILVRVIVTSLNGTTAAVVKAVSIQVR